MGLFANTTDASIQDEVEQATSDKLVEENWGLIMNICDRAGKSGEDAKASLRAIMKRLYNSDPHIGLKAVTLLDACVKNAGKTFHIEVASREFETDFNKLMTKAPPQVAKKLRESLKRWSENEFKSDGQLSLIPSLYHKLRGTYDFSSTDAPVKKSAPKSIDPDVVESQEEEEQILKAIELSLKETSGSPRNATSSSLYPSVNNMSAFAATSANNTPAKESRKVRALYDFEAAEDNELTFNSGEIIMVLDDSDPNWWKGTNHRGEGLFPANFVTADLSVEPEKFLFEKAKKMVQFKEEVKVLEKEPQEIELNEGKIDRLLHLLHEADPTNPEADTDELLNLEREVNAMGPLIDSELERVDRKHAELTQISGNLVEALGLYHSLMREPQYGTLSKPGFDPMYGYMQHPYNGPMHHLPQHSMGYSLPSQPGVPPNVQERLQYHPHMPQYQMGGMQPNSMGGQGMQPPNPMGGQGMMPSGVMGGQGMPQSNQQRGMPVPQGGLPPNQQGALPPNQQGGLPNHLQQIINERRMDGAMVPQFQPGMPANFGPPPGLPQPAFPPSGPHSQTSIPNGPNQPQFVSSSTHIMH